MTPTLQPSQSNLKHLHQAWPETISYQRKGEKKEKTNVTGDEEAKDNEYKPSEWELIKTTPSKMYFMVEVRPLTIKDQSTAGWLCLPHKAGLINASFNDFSSFIHLRSCLRVRCAVSRQILEHILLCLQHWWNCVVGNYVKDCRKLRNDFWK